MEAAQTRVMARPTRRLRLMILRPALVDMRARNPSLRTRLILLILRG